jgi:hypothetical protein
MADAHTCRICEVWLGGKRYPVTDVTMSASVPIAYPLGPIPANKPWSCTIDLGECPGLLEFFEREHWAWWDALPPEERERLDLEHLRVQFDAWDRWVSKELREWRRWNRWWRWV